MDLNGIKVSSNILDMYTDGRYDTVHHIILDLDNKRFLGYVGTREDSLKAVEGTNFKVVQAQWDGDDGAWDGIVNGPDLEGDDEPRWAYQEWKKDIDSNEGEINDLIDEWIDYEDEEEYDAEEACATEANGSTAGIKKILNLAKTTFEEEYPTYDVVENGNNGLTVGNGNNKVTVGVKVELVPMFKVVDDMGEITYESTSAEDVAFQLVTLARDLVKAQGSATESVKTKKRHSVATESFDPIEKEILLAMKKGRTNIL